MRKMWLFCITAIACTSLFVYFSNNIKAADLLENPNKNIYYIFIPGSIQGSFNTLDACNYCHGNGGKGTKTGKEKGSPDFTDPNWQASKTDAQLKEHINTGSANCTACRGRISDEAIDKLVEIVRNFAKKK